MPRLRYMFAMSLDGYIATPTHGIEWLERFSPEEAGVEAFMAEITGLLMGRDTFDVCLRLGPWPYGELPTVVLTSRPMPADAPPTAEACAGGPAEGLARLIERGARGDIWLVGGGKVAAACLDAGLLTDLEVAVIPVVLGAGIPMMGPLKAERVLEVVECKPLKSGMILINYRVAS